MSVDADLTAPDLRAAAVDAALGRRPFDLLIENARLPDMITGRERRVDVGLIGALIASVHAQGAAPKALKRIDAAGRFILPGFIDSHMHVESSLITAPEFAAAMVPRGVTTAVWDPQEFANVAGVPGVDYAIETARDGPLRFLTLAPSCVPSAPGFEACGGDFGPGTIADLLARPDIHGTAELMTMQPLLNGDPRVAAIVGAAWPAASASAVTRVVWSTRNLPPTLPPGWRPTTN